MGDVYLVDKRSEAFTNFQAAQNRLHRHFMFTAIRTPMTSKENAEILELFKQQAEECFNQALACNSDIEGLLVDRGVNCLHSPELPTMGATQAWGARMKERWVNLEKRVEEALSEGQRSEESLDLVQDNSRIEDEEVTRLSGSNPSRSLDHQSLRHGSHPLTSFTQVSITPRTAPFKPLNQKEDTALSWDFSYGIGRPPDKLKKDWEELEAQLKKIEAPKCSRAKAPSLVEVVKTFTTDLEESEPPCSWGEPWKERLNKRGFLSNRKPLKHLQSPCLSFH